MAKNMIRAAGSLLLINSFVKLLGFVREMVMADAFGASALADAYQVAYKLPYFFQTVLGYAFVSAVLPLLARYWQESGDNSRACRLGSTLINVAAAFMLVLSLAGAGAARFLVWLIAPELPPDTAALAATLTRIIFPSVVFMSVGMVISAILNSRYRFVAAALAPGVASLAVIISAAWLAKGEISLVAWGTLAGFVGFFLLNLADLPRTGFKYSFAWDLRNPEIKRVLLDILPIVLGLAVTQIYSIINSIFASALPEGSIAVLNYAGKVMNLPLGVFVSAIITASFPLLAEKAGQVDRAALALAVRKNLAMILLIALPSAIGLALLNQPIIRLLFEGGQFSAADTLNTGQALAMMAFSVLFLGVSMLLIRVYYVLADVKTPLITGLISIAAHLLMSFLCLRWYGNAAGLALTNTLAAAINALLLLAALGKRLQIRDAAFDRELIRVLLASAILTAALWLAKGLMPAAGGKAGLALALAALIGGAIVLYFIVLKRTGSQSLQDIYAAFRHGEK